MRLLITAALLSLTLFACRPPTPIYTCDICTVDAETPDCFYPTPDHVPTNGVGVLSSDANQPFATLIEDRGAETEAEVEQICFENWGQPGQRCSCSAG